MPNAKSQNLSPSDLATLRERLLARKAELEQDMRTQLHATGLDRQGGAATPNAYAEPHDRGDESVADEQTALAAAQITRDSDELAAIAAALTRMASGHYGVCLETGEVIERERLFANPTATRSFAGQTAYEKSHGQRTPSL